MKVLKGSNTKDLQTHIDEAERVRRFYVVMGTEESHTNHPVDLTGIGKELDQRVIAKIREYTERGNKFA